MLMGLEYDLKGLLTSWFDGSFHELTRICWDSSKMSEVTKAVLMQLAAIYLAQEKRGLRSLDPSHI